MNKLPKYRVESNECQGKKSWYVVRRPISVIAECSTKADARRIRNALSFFETLPKEKQILSELLI